MITCAMEPTWNMIGTGKIVPLPELFFSSHPPSDVDELSLQYARKNVKANNLQDRIQVRLSTLDSPLLFPLSDESTTR